VSGIFLSLTEREREREREIEENVGGGSERHCVGVGVEKTISAILKVPRQCPLVLLVGVNLIITINSRFNFLGVRGAPFKRNSIRH
jgi:hypothetical protein